MERRKRGEVRSVKAPFLEAKGREKALASVCHSAGQRLFVTYLIQRASMSASSSVRERN